MSASETRVEARRVWIAKSGLMFRNEKSGQHTFLQAGAEVSDIAKEDLADYIKKGLVEQTLVEA